MKFNLFSQHSILISFDSICEELAYCFPEIFSSPFDFLQSALIALTNQVMDFF